MDPQLLLFRRQYFQLFEPDFLAWPPKQLLKDLGVQGWLYNKLFNADEVTYLPPDRYRYRVLKPLVTKIEQSIEDPEEDVGYAFISVHPFRIPFAIPPSRYHFSNFIPSPQTISDELVTHLSSLVASGLLPEIAAVQQKSYVTFSCLSPEVNLSDVPEQEPTITVLERRNLISGSTTTGYRTWEAALHLGSYLLSNPELIRDKNVFEPGAGTGFLSILCAKHLEAKHVTTTDGDESVVEALKENLFLNGLDESDTVKPSVLRWGRGLRGTWVEEDFEEWPCDVVVGADVTYDKTMISTLVATLRFMFDLRPSLQVLLSTAVRNAETYEGLQAACAHNKFNVKEIDFQQQPIREQTALFYATAVPLKILSITKPD
ncbi:uncharacterized protein LTR77_001657 [Saxophila tyrrhenica]|uniref:Uncharacterized protein n=1 Tax=Saxophila tyrrhenica TaxID=1690608 RepID=A0AAV9PNT5_9PEZI|nr:hypothetical protein LTR77_001657 [Saxophila tyrrhenica]